MSSYPINHQWSVASYRKVFKSARAKVPHKKVANTIEYSWKQDANGGCHQRFDRSWVNLLTEPDIFFADLLLKSKSAKIKFKKSTPHLQKKELLPNCTQISSAKHVSHGFKRPWS